MHSSHQRSIHLTTKVDAMIGQAGYDRAKSRRGVIIHKHEGRERGARDGGGLLASLTNGTTLFRCITMLRGTNNIPRNIPTFNLNVGWNHREYYVEYCESHMRDTITNMNNVMGSSKRNKGFQNSLPFCHSHRDHTHNNIIPNCERRLLWLIIHSSLIGPFIQVQTS